MWRHDEGRSADGGTAARVLDSTTMGQQQLSGVKRRGAEVRLTTVLCGWAGRDGNWSQGHRGHWHGHPTLPGESGGQQLAARHFVCLTKEVELKHRSTSYLASKDCPYSSADFEVLSAWSTTGLRAFQPEGEL